MCKLRNTCMIKDQPPGTLKGTGQVSINTSAPASAPAANIWHPAAGSPGRRSLARSLEMDHFPSRWFILIPHEGFLNHWGTHPMIINFFSGIFHCKPSSYWGTSIDGKPTCVLKVPQGSQLNRSRLPKIWPVAALQRAKVMECQLGAPKNLLCQPECLWGMKFFKLAEVGLCVLKKTCFLPCFWWILGEFWSLHLASYPVFRSVKWISKIWMPAFILMFSHEKWPQLDGYDMPFSSIFRHPKYVWLSCIHINPYQSISIHIHCLYHHLPRSKIDSPILHTRPGTCRKRRGSHLVLVLGFAQDPPSCGSIMFDPQVENPPSTAALLMGAI